VPATLIALVPYPYSRSALPAPFAYPAPSITVTGPVGYGDVVYVDDPLRSADKL
jgi:hypothetical protein